MPYKDKSKQIERNKRHWQENKETLKVKQKEYRNKNKKELSEKDKIRVRISNLIVDRIALEYGCQNHECKWVLDYHHSILQFHHNDPQCKNATIAIAKFWSSENLVEELKKCCVLCCNCHILADRGLIDLSNAMVCQIELIGDKYFNIVKGERKILKELVIDEKEVIVSFRPAKILLRGVKT